MHTQSCQSHPYTMRDAVIARNAAGVSCMMNGDLRTATTSFLAALEDSRGLLGPDCNGSSLPCLNTMSNACVEGPQSFATVEIGCGSRTEAANGSVFAIFNQCLIIPDRNSFDSIFARNEDIIPCILLYNVGLSLQIQGMQLSSEAFISRAHYAYDLALTILKGMGEESMGAEGLLLLLAVLNNLAAIESLRFNLDKAVNYGELIRGLLENEEFADMLGDSIFDFFILYLFLTPRMCQPAAPAA